jgi:hypothetical protein
MYTLIGSAKLNGLDPELYLRHVLTRIADHPVSQIQDFLPWNLAPSLQTPLPKPPKTHSSGAHEKIGGHLMTHFISRQEGLGARLQRSSAGGRPFPSGVVSATLAGASRPSKRARRSDAFKMMSALRWLDRSASALTRACTSSTFVTARRTFPQPGPIETDCDALETIE